MGDNRLSTDGIAPQELIRAMHVLQIITAMKGEWLGRDDTGTPAAGQNLGSDTIPWETLYVNNIMLSGSGRNVAIGPFIRQLISAQEGSRGDDLVEAFLSLATIEGLGRSSALTFTANQAQEITNGGEFRRNGSSVLRIAGYDPIPLFDNFYLALSAASAGAELVGSGSGKNAEEFILKQNGVPTDASILIGRTAVVNNVATPLISWARPSAGAPAEQVFTVNFLNLTGINNIAALKQIIESAQGNDKISQQAFRDAAKTVIYDPAENEGADVPPVTYLPTALTGTMVINQNTNAIYYKNAAGSWILSSSPDAGGGVAPVAGTGTAVEAPSEILTYGGIHFRSDTIVFPQGTSGRHTHIVRELAASFADVLDNTNFAASVAAQAFPAITLYAAEDDRSVSFAAAIDASLRNKFVGIIEGGNPVVGFVSPDGRKLSQVSHRNWVKEDGAGIENAKRIAVAAGNKTVYPLNYLFFNGISDVVTTAVIPLYCSTAPDIAPANSFYYNTREHQWYRRNAAGNAWVESDYLLRATYFKAGSDLWYRVERPIVFNPSNEDRVEFETNAAGTGFVSKGSRYRTNVLGKLVEGVNKPLEIAGNNISGENLADGVDLAQADFQSGTAVFRAWVNNVMPFAGGSTVTFTGSGTLQVSSNKLLLIVIVIFAQVWWFETKVKEMCPPSSATLL